MLPRVPLPDRAELLLLVGGLLPAGTVYLLWPPFTLAYVGAVLVVAGLLIDLGKPRDPRDPREGPDGRRRQGA